MDPIKILKRAWSILWSYRALWVFGLILALTVGWRSGGGGGGGGGWGGGEQDNGWLPVDPRQEFAQGMRELNRWLDEGMPPFDVTPQDWNALIGIGIILAALILVTIVIFTILRYVAETALIRMVDEYEQTGTKTSIRRGFSYGWSRTSWRLFLINLVVNLPVFVLVLFLIVLGVVVFLMIYQVGESLAVPAIIALIGLVFLVIFLAILISVIANLLRHFIWRVCALNQVGVGEALSQGFHLVRRNWKNVGLMWLVMFGLGIGWTIFLFIAMFLLIPLFVITALGGVVIGGLPALLVAGISSLFLDGIIPWIIGLIFGFPLFLLVTILPLLFLSGLEKVFTSSVWTLTFRELSALEGLADNSARTALVEPGAEPATS